MILRSGFYLPARSLSARENRALRGPGRLPVDPVHREVVVKKIRRYQIPAVRRNREARGLPPRPDLLYLFEGTGIEDHDSTVFRSRQQVVLPVVSPPDAHEEKLFPRVENYRVHVGTDTTTPGYDPASRVDHRDGAVVHIGVVKRGSRPVPHDMASRSRWQTHAMNHLAGVGIDHFDITGRENAHPQQRIIGREPHPAGLTAHGNRGQERPVSTIEDRHRLGEPVRDVNALLPVVRDQHLGPPAAGLNTAEPPTTGEFEPVHLVRIHPRHPDFAATAQYQGFHVRPELLPGRTKCTQVIELGVVSVPDHPEEIDTVVPDQRYHQAVIGQKGHALGGGPRGELSHRLQGSFQRKQPFLHRYRSVGGEKVQRTRTVSVRDQYRDLPRIAQSVDTPTVLFGAQGRQIVSVKQELRVPGKRTQPQLYTVSTFRGGLFDHAGSRQVKREDNRCHTPCPPPGSSRSRSGRVWSYHHHRDYYDCMQRYPKEFIQKIPKTDLHVHLDGSLREQTLIDIAREEKIELPSYTPDGLNELVFKEEYANLDEYLRGFGLTTKVMQREEHLQQIAYELAVDNFSEGVRHLEVRFAPQLHINDELSFAQVMHAVDAGLRRAREEINRTIPAGDPEFDYGIIVIAMRFFAPNFSQYYRTLSAVHSYSSSSEIIQFASSELARAVIALRNESDIRVVGFDLAGSEYGYPAGDHEEAFAYIHKHFLNKTVHAGEAYGPESIFQAITKLHADRIGHGMRLFSADHIRDTSIVDRETYIRRLVDFIANGRTTIEVCLTSNLQTAPDIKTVEDHSLGKMLENKLSVTFCTDNRLVSHTTVSNEIELAVNAYDVTPTQLKNIIVYGFKRSFSYKRYPEKRQYVRDVINYYERLEKEYGIASS